MDSQLFLRTFLILACIFVLFALVTHYNRAASIRSIPEPYERFSSKPGNMDIGAGSGYFGGTASKKPSAQCAAVSGNEPSGNDQYRPVDWNAKNKLPSDCMPRDKLTAEDLLPKDAVDSRWAQVNPAGQGSVGDMNLLQAGVHVGLNTVQGSLRNPIHDLRAAPIVEMRQVSPWMQSTISPDLNIKPLM
jgi:hypothetical protein